MNVTCPSCTTVFRVDPAKVPERGVRARCSVCSNLIAVRRPPVAAPALPPDPRQTTIAATAPSAAPAPPVPPASPVEHVESVTPPTPAATPIPEPRRASAVPSEPTAPRVAASSPPPPPPWTPEPPKAFEAPLPATATPPAPAPLQAADASRPAGRFSNPFLQQDPSARARRLARALISDLVVYHPEKRQRGLVDGTLKELFADEIRKSWEEYAEQVGEDVANTTPYFTDALNEILAEGRQVFG